MIDTDESYRPAILFFSYLPLSFPPFVFLSLFPFLVATRKSGKDLKILFELFQRERVFISDEKLVKKSERFRGSRHSFFFAWDFNSAISLILLLGDADLLTAYCAREVRRVNSVWHDALRRNDMLNSAALSRYVTSDNYFKIQNSLYPFERRNQGSGCFAKSTRLQLWISRRNTRFIDPGNYISIV